MSPLATVSGEGAFASLEAFWTAVLGTLEAGGAVMIPLAIGTVVLWWALGHRLWTLRRGFVGSVSGRVRERRLGLVRLPAWGVVDRAIVEGRELVDGAAFGGAGRERHRPVLRELLEERFAPFVDELRRGRTLVTVITITAPLAGLLGTVGGMIETFDAMEEMALFSQSGGIAGGVSKALFTTQMGLAVAIPGLLVGRLADRREERLLDELEQVKDAWVLESARPAPTTRPYGDSDAGGELTTREVPA